MTRLTANQRKRLAGKIRAYKNRDFPKRGGGTELAAMLGISPQLLTNWLAGTRHPSPIQLAKLAGIFKISIQELCSLPHVKRKSKASDLIIAMTKYHETAKSGERSTHTERKRLNSIFDLIYNELGDYL
jgi:transcriptional regulator with XRE-family HTH domain